MKKSTLDVYDTLLENKTQLSKDVASLKAKLKQLEVNLNTIKTHVEKKGGIRIMGGIPKEAIDRIDESLELIKSSNHDIEILSQELKSDKDKTSIKRDEFLAQIEGMHSFLDELLSEAAEEYAAKIQEKKLQSSPLQKMKTLLLQSIDTSKQVFLKSSNALTKILTKETIEQKSAVETISNKLREESTQHFDKIFEEFKILFGELKKKLDDSMDNANLEIKRVYSELDKIITSFYDNVEKEFSTKVSRLESTATESKSKLELFLEEYKTTLLERLESKMKDSLNEFRQNIEKAVNEGLNVALGLSDAISNHANFIKDLIDAVNSVEYPRDLQTYIRIGKETAISAISDMILRTKTNIKIVVPEINESIVEAIKSSRNRARILLVTQFDEKKHSMYINELKQRENIELKNLPLGTTVYGALKDNEEAMFGISRDSHVAVFIHTLQEEFRELFSTYITREIAKARTFFSS